MITISDFREIDGLLKKIDANATRAINNGLLFTVEYRDNGITEKQFKAMHVWFRQCADYLNKNSIPRYSPMTGRKTKWTEEAFKDAYKLVLSGWKSKKSTKDQNTIDPNEVVLAMTSHLATEYGKSIMLPKFPSRR